MPTMAIPCLVYKKTVWLGHRNCRLAGRRDSPGKLRAELQRPERPCFEHTRPRPSAAGFQFKFPLDLFKPRILVQIKFSSGTFPRIAMIGSLISEQLNIRTSTLRYCIQYREVKTYSAHYYFSTSTHRIDHKISDRIWTIEGRPFTCQ